MSKKRPKASKPARPVGDLIVARVELEQRWAWERATIDGLTVPMIRALALRPDEHGGIGRNLSAGAIKNMIAAHRAEQGVVYGDRETRLERRQLEYDTLALAARAALARGLAGAVVELDGKRIEIPPTLDEKASKILLEVRRDEAKMHGDDAAARVDVDVTTHDGDLAELNAELVALGLEPVKAEP